MKIIRASEIGEFYYCCVAWWLKNKGVKQQSSKEIEKKIKECKKPEERVKLVKQLQITKTIEKNLKKGMTRHEEIGKSITQVEKQEVQINYLKYLGYGILVLTILWLLFK